VESVVWELLDLLSNFRGMFTVRHRIHYVCKSAVVEREGPDMAEVEIDTYDMSSHVLALALGYCSRILDVTEYNTIQRRVKGCAHGHL
jgi:hypothetical protein